MNGNNHKNSTGAIILVVIGVLFLLNNFGVLPWTLWFTLWRFWPIFLVLLGLRLLIDNKKNPNLYPTLALLIVLLVLLLSIATVNSNLNSWVRQHMPWMPLNQMMPNNDNNPFNNNMHNRRFRMFFNGNSFDNQDFNLNY